MAVEITDAGQPAADVQYPQADGPIEVSVDHGQDSTGFHEVETGDDTVTADWHGQESTGLFEAPDGPEAVEVGGFRKNVQAKVVTPKDDGVASSTEGAETK